MNKFSRLKPGLRPRQWMWAAVVLAVSAVLTFFLPRETKFGYEYTVGRPWSYTTLIAPYDFPIYESRERVEEERDSVRRNFQPYFTLRRSIAASRLEALGRAPLKGLSQRQRAVLTDELGKLYENGILAGTDLTALAEAGRHTLRVVDGREAASRDVADFRTASAAYQHLLSLDSLGLPPEAVAEAGAADFVEPNMVYDRRRSEAELEAEIEACAVSVGMTLKGQRIIDRGEIVTPEQKVILDSYRREFERNAHQDTPTLLQRVLGQGLLVLSIAGISLVYFILFRPRYTRDVRVMGFFYTFVLVFPLASYIATGLRLAPVYVLPFALVPIIVRVFLDSRTAFVAHLIVVLLASLTLANPYEFLLLQIPSGCAAIYSLEEMTERAQLVRAVVFTWLTLMLVNLFHDLAGGITLAELQSVRYVQLSTGAAVLLVAYPLLYVLERAFGFTSSVTLVELSNINSRLLRRLSKEAPGTFSHSMQVSNLAAEVAAAVGADAQLVRTGALYHDIGKLLNAPFFTENQSGTNPHDKLSEEESAAIIIRHVADGLRLAEEYQLPRVIADFIRTHHGRSTTKFFQVRWQNNHPGQPLPAGVFEYPGPNPRTREQAVVMMCDAVEASSRSLDHYDEATLAGLVGRIIDGQVAAGLFESCDLTFRDVRMAKRVLVECLKTVYHTRIAYPELRTERPAPSAPDESRPTGLFGSGLFGHRS
ncbi:MAG: HDIG domain-containing protein [Prevotellaceae bacterium]|nr:HDIG domain-containing protein [Prevotellaceae bacterium]